MRSKRYERILFPVLFLLIASSGPVLAGETDVEGSKDHPMISRYTGSVIMGYKPTSFDEFQMPLAKSHGKGFDEVKKVEGNITCSAQLRCPRFTFGIG